MSREEILLWLKHLADRETDPKCREALETVSWIVYGCPEDVVESYSAIREQTMRGNKKETTFDDYLKEQLKDPEFRKEWKKLCDEDVQKGKWVTDGVGNITCSNCGFSLGSKVVELLYPFDFSYCPDCGEKMKKGEKK